MYAAAGGASLASRQARRNVRKQHVVSSDAVHQQFQRRFQQLHQEHARLYTDLNGRIPAPCDLEVDSELYRKLPVAHSIDKNKKKSWTYSVISHSSDAVHQQFQRRFQQLHQEHARLYTDLNGRIPAPCDLEMMTSSGMQAAFFVREKQKQRLKKGRKGRYELPSHVATKEIAPFPPYPPLTWGKAAAAWSERERRSSVPECSVAHHHHHRVKVSDNHRKWTRRNRIHDSSFGGSSSEEEEPTSGMYGHQSAAANALLYVGLGTVAIGLIIAFVGTGEKGFKTLELRLIGPTLIGSGVLCCLIRVFLCVCPSHCLRRNRRKRGPPDNEYYRHLPYNARTAEDFMPSGRSANRDNKKRVSIIPTPSTSDKKFIDDSRNATVLPQRVPLPNFVESPPRDDNPIEMRRLEGANSFDDLPSISSEDSFNEPESLALVEGSKKTCVVRDMTSAERLARLKSTLTFQEEEPTDCPRIEEEDSEILDPESPSTTPMLVPPPTSSSAGTKRELVLSPAKLQNI